MIQIHPSLLIKTLAQRHSQQYKTIHLLRILFLSLSLLFTCLVQAESEQLFLNGQLNPLYKGRAAQVLGEVIDIKQNDKGKVFYKVYLRLKGVSPIWVSSFAPIEKGQIKIGEHYVFIGHVRRAHSLDSSGDLEKFLKAQSLLIVRTVQSPK